MERKGSENTMIESFKKDHTKIIAPSINLSATYEKDSVMVVKFDIRLVTPNTTYIDDKTMHSLEHLLATAFKKVFQNDMIDLSPMGCKTGFYFTVFNTTDIEFKIETAIRKASTVRIPKPTKKNCGSYLLHNIEGARVFLERIADEIDNSCGN